jgi:amidohydrolase
MGETESSRGDQARDERIEVPQEIVERVLEQSREIEPQMKEVYRDLHEHPELGGEEFRTAERVKEYLNKHGIEIVGDKIGGLRGKEGTGIVGRIRGKEGGPTVALRADMDALPVREREGHEPRSQNDKTMHACGHDAHTSGLLGGATILKDLAGRGELPGDVLLIFQPSEEKAHEKESGAVRIIRFLEKQGLREKIDAFLGLHVRSDMERGRVNVKEGIQMGSSGEVDITLKGSGGHIMNAYEKPNLHLMFSEITTRLSEAFRPLAEKKEALVASARTIYDGSGYNVLPAAAESTWVVRVASPLYKDISSDIIENIRGVVQETVKKYAAKDDIKISITQRPGYRPVIHRSPELVELAARAANRVIPEVRRSEDLEMAGEDFSFYLEELRGKEIPGVFMMVGAANPEKGIPKVPHHSPDFRIDQDVIKDLAALHVVFTLEAFSRLARKETK